MKCILLIRVSTQQQDLAQQTEKVKAEAVKDGYAEKDIIILEDKESAVKLSEEERNGLNQLKWNIEHDATINCVYSYEVSRISRQPSILYSIRDFLISHHVQLVVLNPYMKMLKDDNTLSETANIFFGIFSSMAENEGYIRKERLARGRAMKKSQGYFSGGAIPMGYRVVDHKLVVNEETAPIVKRIFTDYAYHNKSFRKIGQELSDEGFFNGSYAGRQNVANILSKKYYCGDLMHPRIISDELFEAAQQHRNNKVCYEKENNKKYDTALCKGIIYDSNSGYHMTANNANRQYYVRQETHPSKSIKGVSISMDAIDPVISGIVSDWYNVIKDVKRSEFVDTINADIESQKRVVSTMQKNITENQDKIDRIEERYVEGRISKERADELEHKVFNDLQYYKKQLNDATSKIVDLTDKLHNTKLEMHSMRDKVLYMVDGIYVKRLSKYIAEITVVNKFTGEQRIYEYNTRYFKVLSMRTILRGALHYYA